MNPGKEEGRPHSDLPDSLHSQNEPEETIAEGYEGERYGRIPLRLHDALEMGDLALDEFAILCWLEGRANYNENPPRIIKTLAAIMDALDWEKSDEALRNKLNKLQGFGLIEYEVRANGKRPYVIYLTGCRVILDATWRALGGRLVDSTKPEGPSLPPTADDETEVSPSTHQVEESPIEHRSIEHSHIQTHGAQSETIEQTENAEEAKSVVNNLDSLEGVNGDDAAEVSSDSQSDWRDALASAHGLQPADRAEAGESL